MIPPLKQQYLQTMKITNRWRQIGTGAGALTPPVPVRAWLGLRSTHIESWPARNSDWTSLTLLLLLLLFSPLNFVNTKHIVKMPPKTHNYITI